MRMVESTFYRYECLQCGHIVTRSLKQDDNFECPICDMNKKIFVLERFKNIEAQLSYSEVNINRISNRLDGLEADTVKYIQGVKEEIIKKVGITL